MLEIFSKLIHKLKDYRTKIYGKFAKTFQDGLRFLPKIRLIYMMVYIHIPEFLNKKSIMHNACLSVIIFLDKSKAQ